MRILDIRRIPRWKIWKIDNWEVDVEFNGVLITVTIYHDRNNPLEDLFVDYVKSKVLYGKQWSRKKDRALEKLRGLIGREIG